jgi:hypothetical protein
MDSLRTWRKDITIIWAPVSEDSDGRCGYLLLKILICQWVQGDGVQPVMESYFEAYVGHRRYSLPGIFS